MDTEKYIELFSEDRIKSYESTEEHDRNLDLIAAIAKDLAIIELVFRNKINKVMIRKHGEDWIRWIKNKLGKNKDSLEGLEYFLYTEIEKELNKSENKSASNQQLVSRMMFGFWINMLFYIIDNKIASIADIGNFSGIRLRKYSYVNRNFYDDILKAEITLRLIQKIRNRAFHWENLLKMGSSETREKYIPNIYINFEKKYYAGVLPSKIKTLIKDVMKCFDEEL